MNRFKSLLQTTSSVKVTAILICINVLLFILSRMINFIEMSSVSTSLFLIKWGANFSDLTFSGEYWRLFTSMFLHLNFMHLAVNMAALWSVGTILEKRIPSSVYLGIYLLSGVISSLCSSVVYINQHVISCGASGAILGVILALLANIIVTGNKSEISLSSIIGSLVLTAGAGLILPIDNIAHLSGAVTGFVLGLIASFILKKIKYPNMLSLIIFAIIFLLVLIGIYQVYLQYSYYS